MTKWDLKKIRADTTRPLGERPIQVLKNNLVLEEMQSQDCYSVK